MPRVAPVRRCETALLLAAAGDRPASAQLLPLNPLVAVNPLVKIDPLAQRRMLNLTGRSRVIVRAVPSASPASLVPMLEQASGTILRTLAAINAQVVDVPNAVLGLIASGDPACEPVVCLQP